MVSGKKERNKTMKAKVEVMVVCPNPRHAGNPMRHITSLEVHDFDSRTIWTDLIGETITEPCPDLDCPNYDVLIIESVETVTIGDRIYFLGEKIRSGYWEQDK